MSPNPVANLKSGWKLQLSECGARLLQLDCPSSDDFYSERVCGYKLGVSAFDFCVLDAGYDLCFNSR